jgi:membrane protein implicated in regulation of membrane protease activity
MDILAPFVERLLSKGNVLAAIGFVLVVLLLAAVIYKRFLRPENPPQPTAHSESRGQTTQVADVKTDGDITVSPTQHNG